MRAAKERLTDTSMPDMDAFLKTYPDPEATFYGTPSSPLAQPSAAYIEHARAQLCNDFPRIAPQSLELLLNQCGNHYAPSALAITHNVTIQNNQVIGEDDIATEVIPVPLAMLPRDTGIDTPVLHHYNIVFRVDSGSYVGRCFIPKAWVLNVI